MFQFPASCWPCRCRWWGQNLYPWRLPRSQSVFQAPCNAEISLVSTGHACPSGRIRTRGEHEVSCTRGRGNPDRRKSQNTNLRNGIFENAMGEEESVPLRREWVRLRSGLVPARAGIESRSSFSSLLLRQIRRRLGQVPIRKLANQLSDFDFRACQSVSASRRRPINPPSPAILPLSERLIVSRVAQDRRPCSAPARARRRGTTQDPGERGGPGQTVTRPRS
jgi:hypothetical protein